MESHDSIVYMLPGYYPLICFFLINMQGNFKHHVLIPLTICDECEVKHAATSCVECDLGML